MFIKQICIFNLLVKFCLYFIIFHGMTSRWSLWEEIAIVNRQEKCWSLLSAWQDCNVTCIGFLYLRSPYYLNYSNTTARNAATGKERLKRKKYSERNNRSGRRETTILRSDVSVAFVYVGRG